MTLPDDKASTQNPIDVTPLREAYVAEVLALHARGRDLLNSGFNLEEVARILHAERRALGVKYKELTPPELRERIYRRNLAMYNDPLGPGIEFLRNELGKSWEDIIEGAARPGGRDLAN